MSINRLGSWLEQVSKEDAGDASASIVPGKSDAVDPAGAVPFEHSEAGQGAVNTPKSDLDVKKPEDLGVTDVPHEDDSENQLHNITDNQIKANGDKAPGSKTLGATNVSTEAAHPNEPVVGGKLPEEGSMDQNPRGVTYTVSGDEKAKTGTGDIELDKGDTEPELEITKAVGAKDGGVATHEPQQSREARKALEGDFGVVDAGKAKASIEEHVEEGEATGGEAPVTGEDAPVSLDTPAAPVGNTGADASDPEVPEPAASPELPQDAPGAVGLDNTEALPSGEPAGTPSEGDAVPAGAETAPPSELGASISEIAGETQDPVAQAAGQIDAVTDDLDNMNTMAASVEAYIQILEEATKDGKLVDPLLARTIQVGLEAFGEPWLGTAMPSLEAFSGATSRYVASNEALDGLKARAAGLKEGASNAIKKLIEWAMKAWEAFQESTLMQERKITELRKVTHDFFKSEAQGSIKIVGADRLMVGDAFAGDSAKALLDLYSFSKSMFKDYPKLCSSSAITLIRELTGNSDPTPEMSSKVYESWARDIVGGFHMAKTEEAPEGIASFSNRFASAVQPGNYAFYLGYDTGKNGMFFQVNFKSLGKSGEPSLDVKVPNVQQIAQLLDGVHNLIDIKDLISSAKNEVNNIYKSSLKFVGNVKDQHAEDKLMAGHAIDQLIKANVQPLGEFTTYLNGTIKAYMAVIQQFLQFHQKAGAAPAEGAEPAQA